MPIHVVIASKCCTRYILHAILRPFHWSPEHNRRDDSANISRIDADFVSKTTTNIWANNSHLGFWNTTEHRNHCPNHVRGLRSHPSRQLTLNWIETRNTAASLEWAGVNTRIVHMLRYRHWRMIEYSIGSRLIPGLPCKNVVMMIARAMCAFSLSLKIFAKHRGVRLKRRVRINDHGKLFIFDFNRLNSVSRNVSVISDHNRHFLHLKMDFLVGQNSSHVAC